MKVEAGIKVKVCIKKSNITESFITLVLSLYFSYLLISYYFKEQFGFDGIGEIIVGITALFFGWYYINNKPGDSIHIKANPIPLFCAAFILSYLFNYIIGNGVYWNGYYAKYFFPFFFIPWLIPYHKISIEKVFTLMMIITVPIELYGTKLWIEAKTLGLTDINMGISYAMLPLVIAFILHFVFFRRINLFYLSLYFVNFIFTVRLIRDGIRGSSFAVVALLLYVIIDHKKRRANISKLILSGLAIAIIVISLYAFKDTLLIFAFKYLDSHNINISIVSKSYYLFIKNGTTLNERDNLWNESIRFILHNPLGIGVGNFESIYDGYPHNIILQLCIEYGGIIGLLVFCSLIVLFLKSISFSFESKVYIVFLFFASIPRLLFSYVYWREQFFWLFVIHGYAFCLNLQKNR